MSHLYSLPSASPIPQNPDLQTKRWPAKWACHPGVPRTVSSVQLFRLVFELDEAPASFVIHVSADQRYRLFVNETEVAWGPARGDLHRWRYETVDIAPFLTTGKNILAAQVHYFAGDAAPVAQQSAQIGFLCQGDGDPEAVVGTPAGWRVWHDESYTFTQEPADALWTYSVVGPSEIFAADRHPWGWRGADFDDSAWPEAQNGGIAAAYGCSNGETSWWMVPRTIPMMETTPEPIGRVVRSEEILPPGNWPEGGEWLTIPPDTRIVLLFDRGHETCGFPEITTSGGRGAVLKLSYAEALVLPDVKPNDPARKGNRNDVGERALHGYTDTWTLDGGTNRLLRPLWWRTFRYAEMVIQTQAEAVTIERLRNIYTGYPFVEKARFDAVDRPDLSEIAEIGWRTARLCAHESYMDCPYYEQLQYAGDTRIQCLVTLYTSGDARLFRNAIMQFHDSRIGDGLTQSRFPSRILQVIPPFSLWYIGMVHDYWRHVPGDDAFVRELLPGLRGILQWFRDRVRPDGLLGGLEWWNFVDWCPQWHDGVPPGAQAGGSSIITLQWAIALRETAEILAHFGLHKEAEDLQKESARTTMAIMRLCHDREAHIVYDTPEKQSASQHAAILLCLAEGRDDWGERANLMERVLSDAALTQTTFYFRFYLNRALVAAGMGNRYLDTLQPWHDMKAMGLTTWAENPEPTRSDCHGWSASPNYEFLATVLGVRSGAPGWDEVVVAPYPGSIAEVSGVVPHPKGEIVVHLKKLDDDLWEADITLPIGVTGLFLWEEKTQFLPSGRRQLTLMPPLTTVL